MALHQQSKISDGIYKGHKSTLASPEHPPILDRHRSHGRLPRQNPSSVRIRSKEMGAKTGPRTEGSSGISEQFAKSALEGIVPLAWISVPGALLPKIRPQLNGGERESQTRRKQDCFFETSSSGRVNYTAAGGGAVQQIDCRRRLSRLHLWVAEKHYREVDLIYRTCLLVS